VSDNQLHLDFKLSIALAILFVEEIQNFFGDIFDEGNVHMGKLYVEKKMIY
jgi:hypothetical protein